MVSTCAKPFFEYAELSIVGCIVFNFTSSRNQDPACLSRLVQMVSTCAKPFFEYAGPFFKYAGQYKGREACRVLSVYLVGRCSHKRMAAVMKRNPLQVC